MGRPISCSGTMASTLGKINPFRYRGYVYDEETEMFYLQSRYCFGEKCRFINADVLYKRNLFDYCSNSPIIHTDQNGYEPMVCCYSEMGFGNLMVGITCGGGGMSSASEIMAASSSGDPQDYLNTFGGSSAIPDLPEDDSIKAIEDAIANTISKLPDISEEAGVVYIIFERGAMIGSYLLKRSLPKMLTKFLDVVGIGLDVISIISFIVPDE